MQAAHRHFGRLDVVVNNAGCGHFGTIEEVTEDEARAQMRRRRQPEDREDSRMSKTWLITGSSRGFGRAWTTAALERGDQTVAPTSQYRSPS